MTWKNISINQFKVERSIIDTESINTSEITAFASYYANLPMQYTAIFPGAEFFLHFSYFLSEAVLLSTTNLRFRAKIEFNVYPCKPQFYYIKVGCKGVYIKRTC